MTLIEISGLTVSYPNKGGNGRKVVLNDVDLRVNAGEFITVIGPSGCGKSTVLRTVLGSQFPNQGSVTVDGRQVEQVDRQRGIVYQRYSLFDNLTVLDNIAIGPILEETTIPERLLVFPYLKSRRKWRTEAQEMLDRIGLSKQDGKLYPHDLSGGMRQRVAIAQAMMMNPKVLLMDEPFGALDHSTREDMQLFILEWWEKYGTTIFFVTHDLDEAIFLGTRVIRLSQHYTGEDGNKGVGARIVTDVTVPGDHPRPHEFKFSPEFTELKRQLERDVLDPKHLQHIHDFNLNHMDAKTVLGGQA